jgi:hypothetical protein
MLTGERQLVSRRFVAALFVEGIYVYDFYAVIHTPCHALTSFIHTYIKLIGIKKKRGTWLFELVSILPANIMLSRCKCTAQRPKGCVMYSHDLINVW